METKNKKQSKFYEKRARNAEGCAPTSLAWSETQLCRPRAHTPQCSLMSPASVPSPLQCPGSRLLQDELPKWVVHCFYGHSFRKLGVRGPPRVSPAPPHKEALFQTEADILVLMYHGQPVYKIEPSHRGQQTYFSLHWCNRTPWTGDL